MSLATVMLFVGGCLIGALFWCVRRIATTFEERVVAWTIPVFGSFLLSLLVEALVVKNGR